MLKAAEDALWFPDAEENDAIILLLDFNTGMVRMTTILFPTFSFLRLVSRLLGIIS